MYILQVVSFCTNFYCSDVSLCIYVLFLHNMINQCCWIFDVITAQRDNGVCPVVSNPPFFTVEVLNFINVKSGIKKPLNRRSVAVQKIGEQHHLGLPPYRLAMSKLINVLDAKYITFGINCKASY